MMKHHLSFSFVLDRLSNIADDSLPGPDAQHGMAPLGRSQTRVKDLDLSQVKQAAVLMLLVNNNNNAELILTRRTEYPGVHSGQISLPGGKKEEHDADFLATALRETEEEIGVPGSAISVAGAMSELYIPPSNFLVKPFIGTLEKPFKYIMEESEVQEIISVDLNLLFHPSTAGEYDVVTHGYRMKVPAFKIGPHVVWGATAMMINELKELLR